MSRTASNVVSRFLAAVKPKAKKPPKPGTPEHDDYVAWAEGELDIVIRQEGLEARGKDAIEMYAWDLGYQKSPIPEWLEVLGNAHHVDVKKEYARGQKENH